MSRARNDQDNPTSARKIIEQSQLQVAELRQQYLRQTSLNGDVSQTLIAEFHAGVINYYFALRPYRESDAIGNRWEDVKLWEDNGEWVRGFDQLYDWIGRKRVVETDSATRGRAAEYEEAPDQLPPSVLLRVSTALDDMARMLGIAVNVDSGPRRAGLLPAQEPSDERLEMEEEKDGE